MTEGEEKPKSEKKAPPPNLVIPPKKPKLSKAERRALQEKQRAEKAARSQQPQSGGGVSSGENQKPQSAHDTKPEASTTASKAATATAKPTTTGVSSSDATTTTQKKVDDKSIDLFSHLPRYQGKSLVNERTLGGQNLFAFQLYSHCCTILVVLAPPNPHDDEFTMTLHPAVIELGIKYAKRDIRGGNARCRAMLQVFSTVLEDYVPSTTEDADAITDTRTHFDQMVLKPSFTFWTTKCRPHSVSMGNAFTFLKTAVGSLSRDISLEDMKETLQETIERYLSERLLYAGRAIAQHAMTKIEDGDILLTFGHSETISVLLTTAKKEGIQFYVWVVDTRPLWEGKIMLQALQDAGISCGYIQLNALTYVMQQVTKVFLGASALMSNGSIYGRIGTAGVALLAKDKNIPTLVCCETYKISNKVQLESFTQNELGNPDSLILGEYLKDWKQVPNLKLLNLLYDVTPAEYVSGIVTEVGIIPPSSIAVLLREMNPQDAAY